MLIISFKLNLCSNGMDHGTRHIQSYLLLHSPTNASMHDRCIRRYLKFRGLCLSPCFLGKKILSNCQFMIRGQFQIRFHSSLINTRMKIPAWFPGGKGTNFCSILRLYPVWIFTNIQYKRNFIFSNRSKEFQAYSQTKYLN